MTARWQNIETEAGLLHCRLGVPDRWDVAVERCWGLDAPVSRRRMAQQIRQDTWRAVQRVRGFVPRVLVALDDMHLKIKSGCTMVTGLTAPGLTDRIEDILDNPDNRRRWAAHARARMTT